MSEQNSSDAGGFSYSVSREIAAPVSRVWQAYTTAAEWPSWFGAVEGTVEIDVRPGGPWKATLGMPDGGQFPLSGEFREVVEHERIVLTMDVPGQAPEVMQVAFEESGSGTKATLSQTCATQEAHDQAREGSEMILAGLAAHCAGGDE
ncbi:SRPBCC domain-containing protein [Streptomyces sp. N35]|uniref:SRPBCC family protein n=1 Tax=Streptomyces sp. N35 TaxID=2795730 RepID=UPI0018F7882E|nr:SRPBCC domain-containing protein [Streptomyces sp. N35]